MKRLCYAAVWLFFAPAILLLRGMRSFALWLIRQVPQEPP